MPDPLVELDVIVGSPSLMRGDSSALSSPVPRLQSSPRHGASEAASNLSPCRISQSSLITYHRRPRRLEPLAVDSRALRCSARLRHTPIHDCIAQASACKAWSFASKGKARISVVADGDQSPMGSNSTNMIKNLSCLTLNWMRWVFKLLLISLSVEKSSD
ncbi:hypothetical protein Cni_G04658 [Canna indica]|uniref:Uncharacterized protein n=1 Tax=Canna indica TaxID=4628 RepID=A0AAQ3JWB0_9LILI|nr:hypothetical protein Cni_G04658 [Canna indica]